jgi:hypothetical protein
MLGWVKASRALLVWPDRGNVLQRKLDIVLLHRFSQRRKINLGLLTFVPEIRQWAQELGIPVFDTMDNLPDSDWESHQASELEFVKERVSDKHEPYPLLTETGVKDWFHNLSRRSMIVLTIVIVTFSLIFIGVFFPSATITIFPAHSRMTLEFEITPLNLDNTEGRLPQLTANTVFIRESGQLSAETSGKVSIPLTAAKGSVVFTNLTSEQVTIPVNTILRTSAEGGLRFRTIKPANLDREMYSTVKVPIEALAVGQSGNVPSRSIVFIEGPLGLILSVVNPDSLSGGLDTIMGMVTEQDLLDVESSLTEMLLQKAELDLENRLDEDQILVKASIEPNRTVQTHFSHEAGDVVDQISLETTIEFSAISLNRDDLLQVAMANFRERLPKSTQIIQESLQIDSVLVSPHNASEGLQFLAITNADTYEICEFNGIASTIRGQTSTVALNLLFQKLDLSFVPEIEVRPSWFPVLPLLNQRIELRCEAE